MNQFRGRFFLSPGLRYMAAGAFFFSLMALMVKLVGQRLPSQEIVLVRGAVGLLATWLMLRHARVGFWGQRHGLLLLRGLLGFGALSCFYYAIVRLPLADVTVLQFTNPIFAALIAGLFLGETIGRREVWSIVISLGGVLLLARPAFLFGGLAAELDPVAVGVALLGAVLSASAYVSIRKLGSTEHALVIVHYFALLTVICALPSVVAAAVWPTPREWILLVGVGLTTQAAQISITRGLHLEATARASAMGYLQIVFAALWGVLFFREYPGFFSLVGACMIIGGTLVLAWTDKAPAAPQLMSNGAGAPVEPDPPRQTTTGIPPLSGR